MSKLTKQEQSIQKAAYWRDQIDAWRQSGLSQAEYCRQSDLSADLFRYWKRRLETIDAEQGAASSCSGKSRAAEEYAEKPEIVPLLAIQLSPIRPSEPVVLVAGGYRVELRGDFCATALTKLLSMLGQAA